MILYAFKAFSLENILTDISLEIENKIVTITLGDRYYYYNTVPIPISFIIHRNEEWLSIADWLKISKQSIKYIEKICKNIIFA